MAIMYNWGVFPKVEANFYEINNYNQLGFQIKELHQLIPRGNGRCYGDSSLQKNIISSLKFNKILFFDTEKGIIKCESGVLLGELLKIIVPKGFFLPVTPGTKFITLGGAIASNIHGKNHHKEGAISLYVEAIELMNEFGETVCCTKHENLNLFKNTIGGMGLTGFITAITISLKKIETSYIKQKTIKARNLNEIFDFFEKFNNYSYSVAWIDCLAKGNSLGRSVLILGEHALKSELYKGHHLNRPLILHSDKQVNIPFFFPSFILNKISIKSFNALYYYKQFKNEHNKIVHYNSFFYPLDAVNNWNRVYGKKGFTQYQFLLPFNKGREGVRKILSKIASSGCGSFLAVLKTFGVEDNFSSIISFPTSGYTLALDFKISKQTLCLLNHLDEIVVEYGGRLYLTKDARMSKETFNNMYKTFNHSPKFNSLQSQRLNF